jgi:hypothetical protein
MRINLVAKAATTMKKCKMMAKHTKLYALCTHQGKLNGYLKSGSRNAIVPTMPTKISQMQRQNNSSAERSSFSTVVLSRLMMDVLASNRRAATVHIRPAIMEMNEIALEPSSTSTPIRAKINATIKGAPS